MSMDVQALRSIGERSTSIFVEHLWYALAMGLGKTSRHALVAIACRDKVQLQAVNEASMSISYYKGRCCLARSLAIPKTQHQIFLVLYTESPSHSLCHIAMLRSTLSFLFASLTTWVAAQSSGSMSTECKSPTCSTLPAQYFTSEGSKRVAIQYGPYTTPPRTMMSGMKDFEEDSVEMPCMDCLITWMKADLHYVNGTEANANTGLWLHHTLLANVADRSPACGGSAVRFFASGNERTAADICVNGYVIVPFYFFGTRASTLTISQDRSSGLLRLKRRSVCNGDRIDEHGRRACQFLCDYYIRIHLQSH